MNKGLIFTFLIVFPRSGFTDSLRCGGAVVKAVDSSNTLMKKCGDPQHRYSTYIAINDHGRRYAQLAERMSMFHPQTFRKSFDSGT